MRIENDGDGSVTHLICLLKGNASQDDVDFATRGLLNRYFERLVRLARARLSASSSRASDEEDLALSAFQSFYSSAAAGRFPRLEDRDDLWKLLVTITGRKAINQVRREHRLKRGGGHVVSTTTLVGEQEDDPLTRIVDSEPTPEFAALVADEYRRLLESLEDVDLRRIAQMKLEGYTNKEIADHLVYSERKVERKLAIIRRLWDDSSPA